MIYMSESAIERLDLLGKKFIRVKIFFGGCNGFKYKFEFPEAKLDEDIVFENNGKCVLTDSFSLTKIDESIIDFVENLMEEKFFISKKDFKRVCHCGTSFKA
ncbi:MAG: iron-sulfur cluster assembly accessory protein [Alphaproteobacteria bacterium]|nr:MAG: iron-sulfur cluster assembly accessory protein [Alphaproteobacteria bacterium]